ncbi:MAG TPA: hypothetical protein VFA20_04615 [Myxococcaceae bacterium]|nr:hypothetical protein [Myxococcaceae bacterium]
MPLRRLLLVAAALSLACLDALYEDPPLQTPPGGWVVCCVSGRVNTCPCLEASGCDPDLLACAAGACAPRTAGSCGGGGGDAGSGDGGSSGDGGTTTFAFTTCCRSGLISTCACDATGCDAGPFTACRGSQCVSGAGSTCP